MRFISPPLRSIFAGPSLLPGELGLAEGAIVRSSPVDRMQQVELPDDPAGRKSNRSAKRAASRPSPEPNVSTSSETGSARPIAYPTRSSTLFVRLASRSAARRSGKSRCRCDLAIGRCYLDRVTVYERHHLGQVVGGRGRRTSQTAGRPRWTEGRRKEQAHQRPIHVGLCASLRPPYQLFATITLKTRTRSPGLGVQLIVKRHRDIGCR